MNLKFWVKKPRETVTKQDNTYKNFNYTNTTISINVFEGGVVGINVNSFDPAVAEAIFNRVYSQTKLAKKIDEAIR